MVCAARDFAVVRSCMGRACASRTFATYAVSPPGRLFGGSAHLLPQRWMQTTSTTKGLSAVSGWMRNFEQRRGVSVSSESTPNPDSMMFHPSNRYVMEPGAKPKMFTNKYDTNESPLAAALFKVKGVKELMLAQGHVTVTKVESIDWELVEPNIQLVMSQFFAAGLKAVKPGAVEMEEQANYEPGSLEAQILELLEDRVRPFVQQDGGDVEFERFVHEEGALYLRLHGACSGCPKSNVTLQLGIKNLMQHYIPEVKEVIGVEDEEEDIPRPHR